MRPASLVQWRELPFVRLLAGLIGGILISWTTGPVPWPFWANLLFVLFAAGLLWVLSRRIPYEWRTAVGLGIFLWVLLLGFQRTSTHFGLHHPQHFSRLLTDDSTLWVHAVVQEAQASGERFRLTTEVEAVSASGEHWHEAHGHLLWYWTIDSTTHLVPGTEVSGRASIARLRGPQNPDAFDYAAFQARKNVFYRANGAGQITGHRFHLRGLGERWRTSLMTTLREHLPAASNELAVGAALILGKRDELQQDLRNAYADTGAIHVLAVSGLHVGFVAFGLGWLLGLGLLGRRSWRWVRLVLILLGIWAFALVTGLSPSVQRAATMFSFIQLGLVLDRRASIYNTLAASAFVLLLVDPFLLFDVGFQLSYLAVTGIIFFQPKIYRAWHPPNRLLDYCWKLTAVAIAAQLTTFPISIYYFHQFPVLLLALRAGRGNGSILHPRFGHPLVHGAGRTIYLCTSG